MGCSRTLKWSVFRHVELGTNPTLEKPVWIAFRHRNKDMRNALMRLRVAV